MKIPIMQHEFNTFLSNDYQNPCSHDDLQTIFQVSDSKTAIALSYNVLSAAIIGNPPSNEKAPNNPENPRDELVNKIDWTYDPVPYVIGYYAIGTILTYAAICQPQPRRNKPDVVTILTLDLRERWQ
ncbi:5786_t:CDS:2 [Paraglomus brasilianum]|uniref:5786_t:CDS:1 n=1 Tax=Paraglomus brasilianum TaxID=144538 RepID=A0A9N9EBE1_9GLOM|nr:5786_t:CDS:2 [Paraglomus brasilianum]